MKFTQFYLIIQIFLIIKTDRILCRNNDGNQEGMYSIGLALESFNPCPDQFIYMEREIGRSPSEENYWDGTFRLTTVGNLPESRIDLSLTHPADITMDNDFGKVYKDSDRAFRIFLKETSSDVTFTVNGNMKNLFPEIDSVKLNNRIVCKNPKKVTPTILSPHSEAISTN